MRMGLGSGSGHWVFGSRPLVAALRGGSGGVICGKCGPADVAELWSVGDFAVAGWEKKRAGGVVVA